MKPVNGKVSGNVPARGVSRDANTVPPRAVPPERGMPGNSAVLSGTLTNAAFAPVKPRIAVTPTTAGIQRCFMDEDVFIRV
jgi:hypothetical protein